jgi:hypothetical protein
LRRDDPRRHRALYVFCLRLAIAIGRIGAIICIARFATQRIGICTTSVEAVRRLTRETATAVTARAPARRTAGTKAIGRVTGVTP